MSKLTDLCVTLNDLNSKEILIASTPLADTPPKTDDKTSSVSAAPIPAPIPDSNKNKQPCCCITASSSRQNKNNNKTINHLNYQQEQKHQNHQMLIVKEPTNGTFRYLIFICIYLDNNLYDLYSYTVDGTSARCDIQPYCAYNDSGTLAASLLDRFNKYITLLTYFVNQTYSGLNNSIIDTHFVILERFGELLTFVARLKTHRNVRTVGRYIKGIASDKQTTIPIDLKAMIGATMGVEQYIGDTYILLPDHDPAACQEGKTLTFKDDTVQKLEAYYNDTFDFQT